MPMTAMCLCFLVRTNASGQQEVLLGRKNQGMGQGKIVGPGGHIEPGEDALTAAAREVKEETGLVVDPASARQLASISFRFPARPSWDQHAGVFVATRWTGELTPSGELTPALVPDQRRALPRDVGRRPAVAATGAGRAAAPRGVPVCRRQRDR